MLMSTTQKSNLVPQSRSYTHPRLDEWPKKLRKKGDFIFRAVDVSNQNERAMLLRFLFKMSDDTDLLDPQGMVPPPDPLFKRPAKIARNLNQTSKAPTAIPTAAAACTSASPGMLKEKCFIAHCLGNVVVSCCRACYPAQACVSMLESLYNVLYHTQHPPFL
jgi:hypothetical protein